jgi:hypothetical protein
LQALKASSLEEVKNRLTTYRQTLPELKKLSGSGLYNAFLNSTKASLNAQND